jgi:hypothetical protein
MNPEGGFQIAFTKHNAGQASSVKITYFQVTLFVSGEAAPLRIASQISSK